MISTSFADIFYNNCFKNGILPIRVDPEDLEKLMDDAERGANATLSVDLEAQEIRGPDGGTVHFDIDPFRKHCLLEGARRHRPDDGQGARDRRLRGERRRRPPLGVRTGMVTARHDRQWDTQPGAGRSSRASTGASCIRLP